jgi:predicted permease
MTTRRRFRFTRRSTDDGRADVREEFAFHLDARVAELVERGMHEQDARAKARAEFGDMNRGERVCVSADEQVERRRWIVRMTGELLQDLRYGGRLIGANRTFSIVAILTLALAIGGNTAIFSIVNAVLLKPSAVADPDRLVRIYPGENRISAPNAHDLLDRSGVLSDVTLQRAAVLTLNTGALPVRLVGYAVSRNHFTVLGTQARLGRTLLPADTRDDLVVLSDAAHRARFGADPSIVGRTTELDGRQMEIIGVMPPSFRGITPPLLARDFWIPLTTSTDERDRNGTRFEAIGRLRSDVSRTQAAAALKVVAAQMRAVYPDIPEVFESISLRGVDGLDALQGFAGALLPVLMFVGLMGIAAAVVLLVACANLAGLLMGRAVTRAREIAVRMALGAGRARLVRQLLTESLLLALLGALAGIGLAVWSLQFLEVVTSQLPFPVELDVSLDRRVLGYAIGLSVLTALAFGIAPARAAARIDLVPALKDEGVPITNRQRFRRALVAMQVAACTILLLWSGLFLRSLLHVNEVDPGFDPNGVLLASVSSSDAQTRNPRQMIAALATLQESVRTMPGVDAAGMSWAVPLTLMSRESFSAFQESDAPHSRGTRVDANRLTPGWFSTVRIALKAGRDFTWQDRESAPPVIIVNQTLANQMWQGSAIGRHLSYYGPSDVLVTAEIVGIVADSKYWTIGERINPTVYLPVQQWPTGGLTLHVRTSNLPATADGIRRAVARLDPALTVELKPMRDAVAVAVMPAQVGAMLSTTFAGLAALLAMLGIYGLIAFVVAGRTKEIGIRRAVGASTASIMIEVLVGSGKLVATGVAAGLALGAISAPALGGLIVNVSPTDPWVVSGAAAVVIVAALAASVIPALRAAQVDPVVALRSQ